MRLPRHRVRCLISWVYRRVVDSAGYLALPMPFVKLHLRVHEHTLSFVSQEYGGPMNRAARPLNGFKVMMDWKWLALHVVAACSSFECVRTLRRYANRLRFGAICSLISRLFRGRNSGFLPVGCGGQFLSRLRHQLR